MLIMKDGMSNKELQTRNYEYCADTIDMAAKINDRLVLDYLELGSRLYEIYWNQLFLPAWDTWSDFLEEVKMSSARASRLIGIYKKLILDFKIEPKKLAEMGGWSNISDILPYAENKEQTLKLIEELEPMRRQDRRDTLRQREKGEHEHEWHEIHVRQCSICGLKEKIYDVS